MTDAPRSPLDLAERSVVGSLLKDSRLTAEVIDILRGPDDLSDGRLAAVYEAIVDLCDRGGDPSAIDVLAALEGKMSHDEATVLLTGISDAATSNPAQLRDRARLVAEAKGCRELTAANGRIAEVIESGKPLAEIQEAVQAIIYEACQTKREAGGADAIGSQLMETFNQLQAGVEPAPGLKTGFYDFDNLTGGLHAGELVIVAGRPGMGKTAAAMCWAINMAGGRTDDAEKQPGLFVSLEMSKLELGNRMLASHAEVELTKIRRNMIGRDEFARLESSVSLLSKPERFPLYVADCPEITPLGIRALARRHKQRHGLRWVIVDYLQLLTAKGSDNRERDVAEMSKGLKAMARELEIPVVCLCQINRAVESREGHRPRMSDLRESGAIEQDADVVMMCFRKSYYHQDDPRWVRGHPEYDPSVEDERSVAEWIVAKQRNGPAGTVKTVFHGPTTTFHNLHRQPAQQSLAQAN